MPSFNMRRDAVAARIRKSRFRNQENAMISTTSRRAMLSLALSISTVSFVTSHAYVPAMQQLARPENRNHRAEMESRRMAPPVHVPVQHEDPFAEMIID
jgi:hypothetical protein